MSAEAVLLPGEALLLAGAALLALVALAVVLWPSLRVYLDFHGPRVVTCPRTGSAAAVELDPLEGAVSVVMGDTPALRLRKCSRWPEDASCGQTCLEQIERAPMTCLARAMLVRWYAGRACVLCRTPFHDLEWAAHKPALRAPDGTTVEWREVRAETLPEVLETHRPVCWNCHVAETFRRRHPELVTDRPWTRERLYR